MSQKQIDLQDEWEDSLENDSKPKFKFPINFLPEELEMVDLQFPSIEIKDPEPVKKSNMKTITFKKTKGGLF